MKNDNTRSLYLDTAKGIGILAVIIAHIVVGNLRLFFYIFHLPLFFIISGYFFNCYDLKKFATKRLQHNLIPYFSCAAIIALYQFCANGFHLESLKMDFRLFLLQQRYTTLWFLATLFCGVTIFWLIFKITRLNTRIIYLISIILSIIFVLYDTFINFPLPWNLDTAFIVQIYLAFGYFLKEHNVMEKLTTNNTHKLLTITSFTVIAVVLSYINAIVTHSTYEMFYGSYGLFPFTIAAAILLSVAVIVFSFTFQSKVLAYFGRNSMIYFAFHQSIGIPIAQKIAFMVSMQLVHYGIIPINAKTETTLSYISYILVFIFVMLICFIADIIIRKTPLKFIAGKTLSLN